MCGLPMLLSSSARPGPPGTALHGLACPGRHDSTRPTSARCRRGIDCRSGLAWVGLTRRCTARWLARCSAPWSPSNRGANPRLAPAGFISICVCVRNGRTTPQIVVSLQHGDEHLMPPTAGREEIKKTHSPKAVFFHARSSKKRSMGLKTLPCENDDDSHARESTPTRLD